MNRDVLSRKVAFYGSLLTFAILIFDRVGGLDYCLKIPLLETVAHRFELSYGPDASRPIKPSDKEWTPTLDLIREYSRTSFPKDKQPKVIARFKAVSSSQEQVGKEEIAQWTAPSTPLAILFKDWPGASVAPDDYRVVGSIGDLRSWVNAYRDKWKFITNDLLLGVLAVVTTALSFVGVEKSPNNSTGSDVEFLCLC
jgi:hypothetical protein